MFTKVLFTIWIIIFFLYTQQLHEWIVQWFSYIYSLSNSNPQKLYDVLGPNNSSNNIDLSFPNRMKSNEISLAHLLAQFRPNISHSMMLDLNSFKHQSTTGSKTRKIQSMNSNTTDQLDALIDQLSEQDRLLYQSFQSFVLQSDTYWSTMSDRTLNFILHMIDHHLEWDWAELLKLNHWFKWDTLMVWNFLAFHYWPLLAGYYNLTLTGSHMALLEPIHLGLRPIEFSSSFDLKDDLFGSEFDRTKDGGVQIVQNISKTNLYVWMSEYINIL